jgi:hypothetical protein
MRDIVAVTRRLRQNRLRGDLWVNGSFVTKKIDPEDADIIFCYRAELYNMGTLDQRAIIDWVGGNVKHTDGMLCDSHQFSTYPKKHDKYWASQIFWDYWVREFGFSRRDIPKGIPVITV